MKRLVDILFSAVGLVVLSPLLLTFIYLVWRQDRHSPFYIPFRVGKDGVPFKMVKLRSMVVNADKSGVDSTSSGDSRITPVGHMIRRYKLDEFMQLWNVLIGDMSLVGPRPNVSREVDLYTDVERGLLKIKPGITDFSSIVFSDEGDILKDSSDPDLDYNRLIRPWKNRMGLFYVEHSNVVLDFQLILLTIMAIVSRDNALKGVSELLQRCSAPEEMVRVALRDRPLTPHPPPGSDQVVQSR
ncbi:MAG: sugar transferase [Magnetococcales bacterium]|nr:sugar transferase [Magnetococcales bacterium]